MAKISVVGSINMDVVTYVDNFPQRGQTVFGEKIVEFSGGKGANQAIAVAKQEKEVTLIGCIGEDKHGESMMDVLQTNQVDTTFLKKLPNTDSGKTSIIVEQSAENTIIYVPGANNDLQPAYVRESIQKQSDCEILLIQLETPYDVALAAMQTAREQGIKVVLDPCPAIHVTDELLKYVDLILPNEQEIIDITGEAVKDEKTAQRAVASLKEKGVRSGILKLGGKGLFVFIDDELTFVEAIQVNAVDTVGAGDCFAGAIVSALTDRLSLMEAAKYANAVAALKVTKKGAQIGIPTLEEITAFCEKRELDVHV
ncbi:ribokinase [Oceanobacillus aidingensis]|uniref:Ribokinase n=1 Tax=Oceanobacillus aidingensis TaxID=645964 RepID=A0ABV9JSI6_9BACI